MIKTSQGNKSCIFPIGYLYISLDSTNPSSLFGGTWEQLTGVFPFACDSSHAAGTTGGEATHTLTIAEMPAHTHPQNLTSNYGSKVAWAGYYTSGDSCDGYSTTTESGISTLNQNRVITDSTGGGQAHNNMPPYKAFYMWVRTA